MESIIFWIFTFLAWEISKKAKISTTYTIWIFILIISAIYVLVYMFNPWVLNMVSEFAVKTFAVSQWIWLFYNKFLNEEQNGK
jgi:hypothetical protein